MNKKEYLVVSIEEGFWGTLILCSSKIPVRKMNDVLNKIGFNQYLADLCIFKKSNNLYLQKKNILQGTGQNGQFSMDFIIKCYCCLYPITPEGN